jgi:hypothetical protein
MLLPGGMPVVYTEDVAEGDLRAPADAKVGERFILSEESNSLTDVARAVARHAERAKVPPVMPLGALRFLESDARQFSTGAGGPVFNRRPQADRIKGPKAGRLLGHAQRHQLGRANLYADHDLLFDRRTMICSQSSWIPNLRSASLSLLCSYRSSSAGSSRPNGPTPETFPKRCQRSSRFPRCDRENSHPGTAGREPALRA